jgi:mono/diheme cytochrome c family protein
MRKTLLTLAALAVAGAAAGWIVTAPAPLDAARFDGLTGDAERGATVFAAAGCASCHLNDETGTLGGGAAFASDFGTFYAPNISTDPAQGIGDWSRDELLHAVLHGVSPEGRHYYPAFPYTAYIKMTPQDAVDLWAHMQTLPADPTPSKTHDVVFPFNITRGLGLWKALNVSEAYVVGDASDRGAYLVEALSHCAECHTPRDALGALDTARWMEGAPNPSGRGTIPALTPDALDWSAVDIAYYLESGFTPEYDSAGGSMAKVVSQTAKLPAADREAIAAYLKALP